MKKKNPVVEVKLDISIINAELIKGAMELAHQLGSHLDFEEQAFDYR